MAPIDLKTFEKGGSGPKKGKVRKELPYQPPKSSEKSNVNMETDPWDELWSEVNKALNEFINSQTEDDMEEMTLAEVAVKHFIPVQMLQEAYDDWKKNAAVETPI